MALSVTCGQIGSRTGGDRSAACSTSQFAWCMYSQHVWFKPVLEPLAYNPPEYSSPSAPGSSGEPAPAPQGHLSWLLALSLPFKPAALFAALPFINLRTISHQRRNLQAKISLEAVGAGDLVRSLPALSDSPGVLCVLRRTSPFSLTLRTLPHTRVPHSPTAGESESAPKRAAQKA